MNRIEHLLTILGEECAELIQEASKAKRFGIDEQRDLPTSNLERMQTEFNDVLALVDMINYEIDRPDRKLLLHRNAILINAKCLKVEKYLLYSKECGTLNK